MTTVKTDKPKYGSIITAMVINYILIVLIVVGLLPFIILQVVALGEQQAENDEATILETYSGEGLGELWIGEAEYGAERSAYNVLSLVQTYGPYETYADLRLAIPQYAGEYAAAIGTNVVLDAFANDDNSYMVTIEDTGTYCILYLDTPEVECQAN